MKDASDVTATIPPSSLIICSRDRPEMLLATVESILAGDSVPNEVVIVDQSAAPHPQLATYFTTRACEIRYLWTRSVGLSRANNMGIAAARHTILAFTHDDVLVTPTWYGLLIQALVTAGPRAVVTGRVLLGREAGTDGFQLTMKEDDAPATYMGRIGEDVLFVLNMAMHRSAVAEIGGFDERLGPGTPFPGAEDNDFGFRLLEAGYGIRYAPQAVLYHRAWRTERDYLPLRWAYGRAQGGFYGKYLGLRDRYILGRMRGDIVRYIRRWPGRLRRLERHQLLSEAIFLLGLFSGAAQWLLTQRKSGMR